MAVAVEPRDPDNRLLSHAHRRRLDAEELRDTMLVVSGDLDTAVGGANIAGAGPAAPDAGEAGAIWIGYRHAGLHAEHVQQRLVLARKPDAIPAPTGNDRTSLVAYIDIDHAGALLEILTEFAKNDVNLSFIQSRPTGRELGHYHFIIDVEGHQSDKGVAQSIEGLRSICEDIRVLGSYPRAR
jgi:hypothetical protein